MSDAYRKPRWALLYLVMPLATVFFALIQRANPVGTERSLLDFGVVLLVGGYAEVWQRANGVTLLHHPLAGAEGEPIYYVREVRVTRECRPETNSRPTPVIGRFYSDLFPVPVQLVEPMSSSFTEEVASAQERRQMTLSSATRIMGARRDPEDDG